MKKKDKYLLIIFFVISLIWTFLVYFNVFNNMDINEILEIDPYSLGSILNKY